MRRIVICCDGTWNEPDQADRDKRKPTNITKIARAVLPVMSSDSEGETKSVSQIVFYDQGVGTGSFYDKITGGIVGDGLEENILDAYRFLAHNYHTGDEVYVFGFSRGAYTARSLTGLIQKCGLLPNRKVFFIPEAFEHYKDRDEDGMDFREKHECTHVDIEFLGVFDTVGARGIPLDIADNINDEYFGFHDVKLSPNVKNAYHALAIDEQRKPFAPTLWGSELESDQKMEPRWFAGVHTNIGGGYTNDGLANCALNWMVDKAKECGLEFDQRFINFYRSFSLDEIRDSMTFYYRMLGRNIREIGKMENGNEVVDPSVKERIEASPSDFPHEDGPYSPKNVDLSLFDN